MKEIAFRQPAFPGVYGFNGGGICEMVVVMISGGCQQPYL
jgi:hypothetical protein